VHLSTLPGAQWVYWIVLGSVFITALYSFRLLFLVFHTKARMDTHTQSHLHESPAVVWLPLVLLAIPSVVAGFAFIGPLLAGFLNPAIVVHPGHAVMGNIAAHYHGAVAMAQHGFTSLPFMLAISGVVVAWLVYVQFPALSEVIQKALSPLYKALINKYGFDTFNQKVLAGGTRAVGWLCWRLGDATVIDGLVVNGSAKVVGMGAKMLSRLQSGYVYHYALAMIVGLMGLLIWIKLG